MRRHIDKIHENRSIMGKWFLLIMGLVLSLLLCCMRVYAADGRLSIAVSADRVNVGSELTVTLTATASGGERATADMEFTYNSSVFSFVSCNAQNYSGGEGGSVSFHGSSVTVKLRAESEGRSNLKLTGSNGEVRESGASLDRMEAAGLTVEAGKAQPAQSADNSLSSLSLSQGELSPEFSYPVTSYTAAVPYETTSLEVNAVASNGKAQITSIEGDSELQVGENTIRITVKAENGEVAVYTITVTRADAPATPPEEENPQGPEEEDPGEIAPQEPEPEDTSMIEEYERQLTDMSEQYQQLQEKYRAEKSFNRKVMAVLIFLIVVLVIICVNIIMFKRGKRDTAEKEMKGEEPAGSRSSRRKEKEAEEVDKEETPARRSLFRRSKKEDWLDEEDVDMESAIFSTTVIPAPRREDGAPEETVSFIDLDDL